MSRKGKKPNPRRQWRNNYELKDKRQNKIYTITFFMGVLLCLSGIMLFQLTIITTSIPLLMALVSGLIATKVDWNRYGKTYYGEGLSKMLCCFLMNFVWWGSLICFLFLAINFYGSTSEKKQENLSIIKWSSKKGRKGRIGERSPIFTIKYKDLEKEFVFGHEYYVDREAYKTITLTTQKGLFGYTTIRDKELLFTENNQ